MQKVGTFLGAMLYGTSWFVGLLNVWAAAVAVSEGRNPAGYLPTILVAFGVILVVHRAAGWFPFKRQA